MVAAVAPRGSGDCRAALETWRPMIIMIGDERQLSQRRVASRGDNPSVSCSGPTVVETAEGGPCERDAASVTRGVQWSVDF